MRLVGKSWPLPLSRAHYEHMALRLEARHAPGLVPKIIHYDETLALIVMELLEPHIIMRRGMIAATSYPRFANDITTFMARTLYFTSDLAMPADARKTLIADFAGNTALVQDHRRPDLHRALHDGRPEPLDDAAARRRWRPRSGPTAI